MGNVMKSAKEAREYSKDNTRLLASQRERVEKGIQNAGESGNNQCTIVFIPTNTLDELEVELIDLGYIVTTGKSKWFGNSLHIRW